MAYCEPELVVSPKNRWSLGKVLTNVGRDGWSVAEGLWEGNAVLAMRWNGDDISGAGGNPQSHGKATWFIVPQELENAIRERCRSVDEAIRQINCVISRPDAYVEGRFSVRLDVAGNFGGHAEKINVGFTLPDFRGWHFDMRQEFRGWSPSDPRMGKVLDGRWESDLTASGTLFRDADATLATVHDALVRNVARVLLAATQQLSG